MKSNELHIGILGAMPEEVVEAKNHLKEIEINRFGDLEIFTGEWTLSEKSNFKIYISLAWSGWGKVSASRAAIRLISLEIDNLPKIGTIIFSGVAGAANFKLSQWDILIPYELIQHDMDARPIFEQFVIPALNESRLKTNKHLVEWSSNILKKAKSEELLNNFGDIYNGLVATGDSFIADRERINDLRIKLPSLQAVEMEGAAVTQVCNQEGVPCMIIRVISDNADTNAPSNFDKFLTKYQNSSWELIQLLLKNCMNWPI